MSIQNFLEWRCFSCYNSYKTFWFHESDRVMNRYQYKGTAMEKSFFLSKMTQLGMCLSAISSSQKSSIENARIGLRDFNRLQLSILEESISINECN